MAPVAVSPAPAVDPVDAIKSSLANVTVTPVDDFDIRDFAHFDTTPSIGTEFRSDAKDGKPALSIRDVLGNPTRLAALGKLVSERGVVFFRNGEITPQEQLELAEALGRAGGKPATSGLHIHPLTLEGTPYGDEVSHISNKFSFSEQFDNKAYSKDRVTGRDLWHSDVTFEVAPSDYATLTLRTLPKVGGDTLWASAYEAYDRLSPALQSFLETLTAVHEGTHFLAAVKDKGVKVREPRGSPDNVGQNLNTVHPVIRTNPVTGWKGLFVNRVFTRRIVELSVPESTALLNFLFDHVTGNHDLQTRFRWEENSLAIWDNRSTFHSATDDLDNNVREGTRSVSVGERPYLDPKSTGRREALAKAAKA